MSGFLLDTSALLTLRDNEPGAARVSQLLREASGNGSPCCGCFMSLMVTGLMEERLPYK